MAVVINEVLIFLFLLGKLLGKAFVLGELFDRLFNTIPVGDSNFKELMFFEYAEVVVGGEGFGSV
jgi:hypothetical protein